MQNFAYLKAKDSINLLIDEDLIGIKIHLVQQGTEVGEDDIEIDGKVILDIEDEDNITIEYLSAFQIIKRKIEAAVYNKRRS